MYDDAWPVCVSGAWGWQCLKICGITSDRHVEVRRLLDPGEHPHPDDLGCVKMICACITIASGPLHSSVVTAREWSIQVQAEGVAAKMGFGGRESEPERLLFFVAVFSGGVPDLVLPQVRHVGEDEGQLAQEEG
jgi:hypothetical protein